MKTLYVTDLDGTLMRNDMTISEESVEILNRLIDCGVLITYATARSFHSAYDITKNIHFKIPVITRNGTTFADHENAKELETAYFTSEVLDELKEKLPIIGTCGFTSVYIDGEMFKVYLDGPKSKEFQGYIDYYTSIGDKRMRMVDDLEKLFEEKNKTSYITLISSKEELLPYYEAVKDSGKWEAIFQKDTYRDEYWLEICPKDATKAKAVLKLRDKLKCDRVVVFGDSKNDLPMFEIADEAISVANAMQETLDASTLTIGSNEEDSVAKYIASETSLVKTRYGSFIPYSGESELRKKNKEPVTYHENGEIASLYFEEIQKVQTPLGEIDAEYLTFYPDGSLKRLFPSYGQLSGYWTEENEYGIAPEAEVTICGRTYKVHPLCIAFYPTGKVKSFTIWNRDTITVDTKYGEIRSNFGFDLTEDGKLKSVEPSFGEKLVTEKGVIYPFDTDNYRLSAENNSLAFDEEGEIVKVKTLRTELKVSTENGIKSIKACKAQDPLTGFERLFSLELQFDGEFIEVTCLDKIKERFPKAAVEFV